LYAARTKIQFIPTTPLIGIPVIPVVFSVYEIDEHVGFCFGSRKSIRALIESHIYVKAKPIEKEF
jgi:hypothetical protein